MSVENLLQKLGKVKKTGNGKFQACCPAHDDKGPSLAIRELDDGRILIHCFAGCGAGEVLNAVGMEFADLYPKIGHFHLPKVRKPWNTTDVLAALTHEILTGFHYAKMLANGEILSDSDHARLHLCAARMLKGLEVARG